MDKKITLKISSEQFGHETLELDAPAAVNRIRDELGAGKWLDVHPGTNNRYPVMDVETFVKDQDAIMGDIFTAQSVVLLPGARGGQG